MMKQLIVLILLSCGCLILVQCEKNAVAEVEQVQADYLSLQYDAAIFKENILTDGLGFSGLLVKVENDALTFEKVKIEGEGMIAVGNKMSPRPSKQQDIDGTSFQFWKDNFEMAYLPWKSVQLVIDNSESIFISGVEVNYGNSIHIKNNEEIKVFSFKLEGDFNKPNSAVSRDERAQPMFVIMDPCPPHWREDK